MLNQQCLFDIQIDLTHQKENEVDGNFVCVCEEMKKVCRTKKKRGTWEQCSKMTWRSAIVKIAVRPVSRAVPSLFLFFLFYSLAKAKASIENDHSLFFYSWHMPANLITVKGKAFVSSFFPPSLPPSLFLSLSLLLCSSTVKHMHSMGELESEIGNSVSLSLSSSPARMWAQSSSHRKDYSYSLLHIESFGKRKHHLRRLFMINSFGETKRERTCYS